MIQNNRFELKQTSEHICFGFSTEHPVLSSAVFNGGACAASNILIMKVAENFEGTKKIVENPEYTLAEYCRQLQLSGTTVGMMTFASIFGKAVRRLLKYCVRPRDGRVRPPA